VLCGVGYGVEFSFDIRFKEAETSCGFNVNEQYVPNSWSVNQRESSDVEVNGRCRRSAEDDRSVLAGIPV